MPRFSGRTVSTGSAVLDAELPGNGWPQGALIDILTQTVGIGEMRLLAPALKAVSDRPMMMLNPPHVPSQQAFLYWGLTVDHISLIRADSAADTLWAAEQILRSGTCGALLVWADKIRNENLRRLQVAASSSTTLLFVLQPIYSQIQASPATLRLVLRPALDGVEVDIIKRRGPTLEHPFFVAVGPSPILTVKPRPMIVEVGDDDVLVEENEAEHGVHV
jgi:cell division inhibitor SulA/protein ImuA